MKQPNDGGPAFPVIAQFDVFSSGMTLRDWFAGQALAGLCANSGGPFQANGMSGWGLVNCGHNTIADQSYLLADALLAAREVKP